MPIAISTFFTCATSFVVATPSYNLSEPLSFTKVSNTSVHVTWPAWNKTRDKGYGPIVGYTIHFRKSGEQTFVSVSKGMQLYHQFDNLATNSEYEFQITVIRDHPFGEGSRSNIQTFGKKHKSSNTTLQKKKYEVLLVNTNFALIILTCKVFLNLMS